VHAGGSRLAGSGDRSGELAVGAGMPLADVYLEFLGGRCRPNTVLAAASDLRVFFTVVAKPPGQVQPADVLAFITAQRTGRAGEHGVLQPVGLEGGPGGVSAATVRRRLSIVSGFFAFLQARGDVAANPVPRGLPTRRERSRPRQGVLLHRAPFGVNAGCRLSVLSHHGLPVFANAPRRSKGGARRPVRGAHHCWVAPRFGSVRRDALPEPGCPDRGL
jgi:Phage integrase, N-terminal SAM-like domain